MNDRQTYMCMIQWLKIPYSGKILQDRTFADFTVCLTYAKIKSTNYNCVLILHDKPASAKFYPRIFILGAIHEKFVLRKFPTIRYSIVLFGLCLKSKTIWINDNKGLMYCILAIIFKVL